MKRDNSPRHLQAPPQSFAPIEEEPSLKNFFSHKTQYHLDSIEFDPSQLQSFLKEYLGSVDKFDPTYQHAHEALSIVNTDLATLSPNQKATSIQALLGEDDSIALIHLLRWKSGVLCPFCGSTNVLRKSPPSLKYQCQDCSGGDDQGGFDELTGYFEKGDRKTARLWVLIHFLKIFMPTAHIAKILGISFDQVLRIIAMMSPQHLVDLPKMKKKSSL